eukprot:gb/GECG01001533.1/.p1 GENE.gb/GECG01001533.1/~~gb/GECG01001533.1/.p1  ORF type:complete len:164 (+),score=11.51 gb/GECG01001533.1/:1-492(+)
MNMQLWISITSSLTLSMAFVGSLYLFVPARIQRLPRDDSLHIWARIRVVVLYAIMATIAVAAASSASVDSSERAIHDEMSFLEAFTASLKELALPSNGVFAEFKAALYGTAAIMVLYSGHFLTIYKMKAYHALVQFYWDDIRAFEPDVVRDLFVVSFFLVVQH